MIEKKNRKRVFAIVISILWVIVLLALSILTLAERWLISSYGLLSADKIIYHINAPLEGANMDVAWKFILLYLLPGMLMLSTIVFLVVLFRKKKNISICIVTASSFAILLVFILSMIDLEKRTGLISYVASEITGVENVDENTELIQREYHDVSEVSLEFPKKKRNLIYIYLESMEMTWADEKNGGTFEKNVIPELTVLGEEYEDFSGEYEGLNGAYSLPCTDWTMAGMFAQSSGMPLKMPLENIDMDTGLFPSLRTMGDILADEGYRQVLFLGSDAEFGGREVFYTTHGFFEMHDYDYAVRKGWIPSDYCVWWGYEDQKLFEFAKEDLNELASGNQPFHFVMLTADTHSEDGYVCEQCRDDFGDNQYANVYACSDRQVSDFVKWCTEQEFWENTTMVICGDHKTMDSDFCKDISSDYQRKTYTVIINGQAKNKKKDIKREYSTLDLFPTTLAAMGVKISDNQLGIGVNLYSGEPTIIEKYGLEECKKALNKRSPFMTSLAGRSESDVDSLIDNSSARLLFTENEGKLGICMADFGDLNPTYIDEIYVEVRDIRTDEVQRMDFHLDTENRPNINWCELMTDYSVEEKKYLEVTGYIAYDGREAKKKAEVIGENE